MKKVIVTALALSGAMLAMGQETTENLLTLRSEARLDYQRDWLDGKTVKDNTGFEGKYINIRVDGNLTDNLSYSWRQRFNKPHDDASFFDATDWLYLSYRFGRWDIAGGKQVVAIGGWEYDRAPIDLYSCSVFWNNVPCYEVGASLSFHPTASDKITAQFCESSFYTKQNRDMYAYNLMWSGTHGIFSSLYSINLMEYQPGKYINYIALGNKFTYEKVSLELDYMNRAASGQTFLFKDCSVMGEISYMATPKLKIHGKMTYDVNHASKEADYCVMPGTELTMAGGGVEFYPLEGKCGLRLHANAYYSWGKNANETNVMQNKTMIFDVGVKWYMDLLSFKRR